MDKLEYSSTAENSTSEKISISKARRDLSKLIHLLESEPNKIIELNRRDTPLALLLSYDVYGPFKQGI